LTEMGTRPFVRVCIHVKSRFIFQAGRQFDSY
jgi:hypothetical protein